MYVMEDPALKSSDIFMIQIAVPEQESCPEWQVLVIYISHKFVGDFSFLFSLLFGLAGNQRYHPQRTVPNANQPSCYSLFFFLFSNSIVSPKIIPLFTLISRAYFYSEGSEELPLR